MDSFFFLLTFTFVNNKPRNMNYTCQAMNQLSSETTLDQKCFMVYVERPEGPNIWVFEQLLLIN